MDILWGLKDKLSFIERFYAAASEPFVEAIRKIKVGEPPFEPPPMGEDGPVDDEPPFLEEYIEADEAKNIVGQAALSLIQSAFREYLDAFIRLSTQELPAGPGNWFARYKTFFNEKYGIDWDKGPVPPEELEEINLARNDIQHSGQEFGMRRYKSDDLFTRFPDGLFAYEIEMQMLGKSRIGPVRIYVTQKDLAEAARRVEVFCDFIEQHRRF